MCGAVITHICHMFFHLIFLNCEILQEKASLMVVNGMPGLAGKPDRHGSPSSLQRGDGDAWRQSARTQVDRGGANHPPLSCRPQIRVSLPWSVTRGCQHPSSGWKMPPFVEGQDEEDFVPAKTLTGNERWCAALLHCHPSLARRQTENPIVSTQHFLWACQPYTRTALHSTMCTLHSMFSFQTNKLRHILRFGSWYSI